MYFAINYSTQAAQLVAASRLTIDRFKCPAWPDLVAEASRLRQVAVHFNLTAGRGQLGKIDWMSIKDFLASTGTPYVNLHLESRLDDFPGLPVDTTETGHRQQILARTLKDVQFVAMRFGAERVIIENVPYRPAGKVLRPSVEPEFIRQVIEETGCGLLLDISHARISAHHLGMDERDYMRQLPVHRLRELHFAGVHDLNGWLQDHLPPLDADWHALRWVMEQLAQGNWPRPWMLAFEYGGVGPKFEGRSDPQVIELQGKAISEIVSKI